MKQKIFIIILSLFIKNISVAQVLYVSPGANIFIGAGTFFFADSLVLTPSADINITGQNDINRDATITHLSSNPYIKRVYHFLNTTTPYSGDITFYYQDAELNGIAENVLTLNIHNGTAWNAYSSGVLRDGVNNFVTTAGLVNVTLNELTLAALSAPLPIRFSFFNTLCITGGVTLTWKTAQEQSSKNFEVQRSANGQSWQTISSVNAAGNSNTERSYSYTDNSIAVNNFYRIVCYDVNGRSTISSTLRSSCALADLFTAYPNPVLDAALVSVKANAALILSLSLYDAKGALVKTLQTNLLPGTNQLPIDMKGLPNGLYLLTAKWGDNVKQVSIIKQ